MSNCACGVMVVAAKNKAVIDRIIKIMTYKDDEYYISRVMDFNSCAPAVFDDDLWTESFYVTGGWECGQFFTTAPDATKRLVVGYEKDKDGHEDYSKPVYSGATITNLVLLAKKLGFGCELKSCEIGFRVTEHVVLNHHGEVNIENKPYEESDEDDVYGDTYMTPKEIYG